MLCSSLNTDTFLFIGSMAQSPTAQQCLATGHPGRQGLASCTTLTHLIESSSCRYDNHPGLILQPSQNAHLAVHVREYRRTQLAD